MPVPLLVALHARSEKLHHAPALMARSAQGHEVFEPHAAFLQTALCLRTPAYLGLGCATLNGGKLLNQAATAHDASRLLLSLGGIGTRQAHLSPYVTSRWQPEVLGKFRG